MCSNVNGISGITWHFDLQVVINVTIYLAFDYVLISTNAFVISFKTISLSSDHNPFVLFSNRFKFSGDDVKFKYRSLTDLCRRRNRYFSSLNLDTLFIREVDTYLLQGISTSSLTSNLLPTFSTSPKTCSICLLHLSTRTKINIYRHYFDLVCIKTWMVISKTCPCCRATVVELHCYSCGQRTTSSWGVGDDPRCDC